MWWESVFCLLIWTVMNWSGPASRLEQSWMVNELDRESQKFGVVEGTGIVVISNLNINRVEERRCPYKDVTDKGLEWYNARCPLSIVKILIS
jgi:hypothetical protein